MSDIVYSREMPPEMRMAIRKKTEKLMEERGYVYAHTVRNKIMQQERASFNAGAILGVLWTLGIQGGVYWFLSSVIGIAF
jgi:hypothetical protein